MGDASHSSPVDSWYHAAVYSWPVHLYLNLVVGIVYWNCCNVFTKCMTKPRKMLYLELCFIVFVFISYSVAQT